MPQPGDLGGTPVATDVPAGGLELVVVLPDPDADDQDRRDFWDLSGGAVITSFREAVPGLRSVHLLTEPSRVNPLAEGHHTSADIRPLNTRKAQGLARPTAIGDAAILSRTIRIPADARIDVSIVNPQTGETVWIDVSAVLP